MPGPNLLDEEARLLAKRAWLDKQIHKAWMRRRYPMPEDNWAAWRRIVPEILGGVFLVLFLIAAKFFSVWIGEIL